MWQPEDAAALVTTSGLAPFLQQVLQQTGAGIFQQVKHPLEAIGTPVVGVGHLG